MRIVGLIVTFDIYPNRISMILDDSSGATIEVTCGRKPPPPPSNLTDTRLLGDHSHGLSKPPVAESEEDKKCHTATGRDIDLKGIDIGSVVKIKGGIGSFRGEKQVMLERICRCPPSFMLILIFIDYKLCADVGEARLTRCLFAANIPTTTEEAAAWAENTAFRRDILDNPWVVNLEEEKRLRMKSEGLNRERKLKIAKGRKKPAEKLKKAPKNAEETRRREKAGERRRRESFEMVRREEANRKLREEEVMRRIEEEDRKRDEEERKRKEEEERKRKEDEERERLKLARNQRNEARERALREMGAGR